MAMDEPPLPLLAPEHLRHPELEERFLALLRGGVGPPLQAYQAGNSLPTVALRVSWL